MHSTSPTIAARDLVHAALTELGLGSREACQETVLVRGGFCVGRRFLFETAEAVWIEAEARIDLYDRDGQLLRTVFTEGTGVRKQAA
jgi:hypothetical protein